MITGFHNLAMPLPGHTASLERTSPDCLLRTGIARPPRAADDLGGVPDRRPCVSPSGTCHRGRRIGRGAIRGIAPLPRPPASEPYEPAPVAAPPTSGADHPPRRAVSTVLANWLSIPTGRTFTASPDHRCGLGQGRCRSLTSSGERSTVGRWPTAGWLTPATRTTPTPMAMPTRCRACWRRVLTYARAWRCSPTSCAMPVAGPLPTSAAVPATSPATSTTSGSTHSASTSHRRWSPSRGATTPTSASKWGR